MRDMGPILEEIRQLKDDRDSWRRVAERLENEKLNALSRLQIAEEALAQIKYEYEQSTDDKVTYRMYKEAKEALEQIQKE